MIALQTNGNEQSFAADPNMPMSWYVTETKSKSGCGMALCGISEETRRS